MANVGPSPPQFFISLKDAVELNGLFRAASAFLCNKHFWGQLHPQLYRAGNEGI